MAAYKKKRVEHFMRLHEIEEAIMTVWNTADDLDVIIRALDAAEELSEDKLLNLLIGLRELHDTRTAQLFAKFEEICFPQNNAPPPRYEWDFDDEAHDAG
jgi:hypothetical protein